MLRPGFMITRVVQAVRPPKVESQSFSKNLFSLPLSILLIPSLSLCDFFDVHMDMYECKWVVFLGLAPPNHYQTTRSLNHQSSSPSHVGFFFFPLSWPTFLFHRASPCCTFCTPPGILKLGLGWVIGIEG